MMMSMASVLGLQGGLQERNRPPVTAAWERWQNAPVQRESQSYYY
jgi:hypothetical protein